MILAEVYDTTEIAMLNQYFLRNQSAGDIELSTQTAGLVLGVPKQTVAIALTCRLHRKCSSGAPV
ncbi:MAG: hypothetical protein ACR2OV_11310 [Hyphomicrobiaceae bacterium]